MRNLTHATLMFGTALAATCLAGCYNSDALLKEVRSHALRSETREISLGQFRTTMPRNPNTNVLTEIELKLFGTVPQYKISAINEQLSADAAKLRFETIKAIRETTADELGEPSLGKLRARLMLVANGVIKDAPIQSIGVKKIRIVDKR